MFDTRRYLDDLDRWLALTAGARARGTSVDGVAREQAADLFRDDVLADVAGALIDASPAVAELVLEAAVDWRLGDIVREAEVPAHEPWPCGPQGPPNWSEAGYWLGAAADAAARQSVRARLEQVGDRVGRGDADLVAEREALGAAMSLPSGWQLWERARGRTLAEVATVADAVLAAVANRGAPMPAVAAASGAGVSRSWVDLPRALAAVVGDGLLPPLDLQLLRLVAGELSGEQLFAKRLRVSVGATVAAPAGVLVIEPGASVYAWLRPLGPTRDYRAAMRLLGRSLAHAGMEDVGGARARAVDPAVAACFGALLESLPTVAAWRLRLLRCAAPRSVAEAFTRQCCLRLCLLSVEVVGAASGATPRSPARLVAPGAAARDATGIDHPEAPVPWSHRGGEAADELLGWLLAAEVEERLASRFGSDWIRHPAAGRLLRDLWAAAPLTADRLAADLGIHGRGDVELLLDRWFRAPAR